MTHYLSHQDSEYRALTTRCLIVAFESRIRHRFGTKLTKRAKPTKRQAAHPCQRGDESFVSLARFVSFAQNGTAVRTRTGLFPHGDSTRSAIN